MQEKVYKERTVNNVIYGIVGQLITIAMGVVIPRLMLTNLGSEVNGLMNSINSAISYLALLEAGVGVTTLQALYGPVAKEDKDSVNSIMAATHYFYKRTGTVYLVAVFGISFVYAFIVHSTINKGIIFCVAMLSGLPGAISYFLQGKYKILLQSEGKSYIITNLTTLSSILISICKIVLLNLGFDVLALQIMYFTFNMMQVVVITIYIKTNYKWIDLSVKPDFSALKQKNQVLVHQISTLIFSSTDTLVLTAFCDLKVVSVYAMYNMLVNMVKTALSTINNSVTFALGQTFNIDKERFYKMHNAYEVCNITITFILFTVTNIFLLPFLRLYTRGVTDISYIDTWLPFLFTFSNLLECGRKSSLQVINYAGHFKETLNRSVAESVINLGVSVILVYKLGIYGVLLGTIAALFYRTNDMIWYASKHILNRSVIPTYRRWGMNFIIYVLVMLGSTRLNLDFESYGALILCAFFALIVVTSIYLVFNIIFDRDSFIYVYRVFGAKYVERLRNKLHV